MSHLTADLAYWIQERYNVKQRKESGISKPWSGDNIFQTVRFCNVHREDDKVTKWIRVNWNKAGDPVWKFVLGRMINLPESLAGCLPWNTLADMKEQLLDHRSRGHKTFTSAYTISTCGKAMDKLDYVFDWVCQRVKDQDQTQVMYESCQSMQNWLTQVDGLGSFLAAQVVADMKNTSGHRLTDAPDFWTFSSPGPGSLRGLSWYLYNEPTGVTSSYYDAAFNVCRRETDPLVPDYIPRISDQDFQNCLCEFSKFMKVKRDPRAHVRNKYPGDRT
jgi:hypothetical protein